MKKDIEYPEVEDIAVAVVKEKNDAGEENWYAYFINLKPIEVQNVLVSSRGYGVIDGEEIKTTTLRHFLEDIPPMSAMKIELIMENVFGLNNEYWVSFYVGKTIYDKKYIFLPESIIKENFIHIPILETEGVMIR
ncbi:MAG: hypothetical protein POELPBGB_01854 [Bacteroidia bacterium]|nr:hypothetical protein [Bacteroidia bacterium]